MASRPNRCRWWGWGTDAVGSLLENRPGLVPFLAERLGIGDRIVRPVPRPDEIQLPDSRLSSAQREALEREIPDLGADFSDQARLEHACGRSYVDLMRIRMKSGLRFPDAVVRPTTIAAIEGLVKLAGRLGVSLVPWGGGTSVVGGVEPIKAEKASAVITVDMTGLDRIESIDPVSETVRVQAGIFGPALEEELAKSGYSLGHFPQSFEFSTVGGWIATRSAGQNSSGYGRIDEMVEGLEMVSPTGTLRVKPGPPGATGPSLREMMVGSEGTLGIITRCDLSIHRVPEQTWTHAYLVRTWEKGVSIIRHLVQEGIFPTIVRLSDANETMLTAKAAPAAKTLWRKLVNRAGKWIVRKQVGEGGCLMLVALEGTSRKVESESRLVKRTLRGEGAFHLGSHTGESWRRDRFLLPYLRDELMSLDVLVETFETATSWSRLDALKARIDEVVKRFFDAAGLPSMLLCHVSHVYHGGASLYFSVISRVKAGEELTLWPALKTRLNQTLVEMEARVSHHHAVGVDHRDALATEWGEGGMGLLRSMKDHLDPDGLLNPGKLVSRGDG